MNRHIRVAITQGDFNGVGPEVAVKSVAAEGITDIFTPILFADWRIVEHACRRSGIDLSPFRRVESVAEARDGQVNVVDLHLDDATVTPGHPTPASGAGAVASLEAATAALLDGSADVLVTAPICKEAAQCDAFRYAGHTEYLDAKAGPGHKAQMILFDDMIRVALVTTHLPLRDVPAAITRQNVADSATRLAATLTADFGIDRPKIAVLSLNPHCGDGGLLGDEEKEVIAPAIADCTARGALVFGPYAADGFFGSGSFISFDGVLAMYHDQGLAPFKALARANGVNFTAGLPFVRTSPDHGTAYDIAWKDEADPTSMRDAIYRAIDIFRCRARHAEASSNPLKRQSLDKPGRNGGKSRPQAAQPAQHGTETSKRQEQEPKPETENAPDQQQ